MATAIAGRLLDAGDPTRVPGLASMLVVVAVGRVRLGGAVLGPSASDLRGTLRSASATVTGTLYVSSNASADRAAALSDRYGLRVSPLAALIAEVER